MYVLACDIKLIGIAVLKKYYGIILESLPDNHTKSISVLSENAPVDEAFFNEILSLTDCKEANHRILNAIILMMKNDSNIIGVCKLVRMLVGSKRFSKEILEFESGKSFIQIYVRTYMHIHMYAYCVTKFISYIQMHTSLYRIAGNFRREIFSEI